MRSRDLRVFALCEGMKPYIPDYKKHMQNTDSLTSRTHFYKYK